MTNADFYLGIGKYARYLGSIPEDGDIATLDDEFDLFGFDITENPNELRSAERPIRYTESDYLAKVEQILVATDGTRDWPHRAYPDSRGTRYAYAWNNGTITVWVYGRQIMLSYPNLSRSEAVFPTLNARAANPRAGAS